MQRFPVTLLQSRRTFHFKPRRLTLSRPLKVAAFLAVTGGAAAFFATTQTASFVHTTAKSLNLDGTSFILDSCF